MAAETVGQEGETGFGWRGWRGARGGWCLRGGYLLLFGIHGGGGCKKGEILGGVSWEKNQ